MLDEDALRAACLELSKQTMWVEVQSVADGYYKTAMHHLEFIEGQGRDPNMLTRAVNYVAHTHADPAMQDDQSWFLFMMMALIELACPNAGQTTKSAEFLADIEIGIEEILSTINEEG